MADGWAFSLIFKKVANCYNQLLNKIEPNYQATNFEIYLENEKDYLASKVYQRDQEFWLRQYEGKELTMLEAKGNKIKENLVYQFSVSKDVYQSIGEYCKSNKSTLFHFFLGLVAISLYRVIGKKDITILLPVLNRSNRKHRDIIGLLMNMIPLNLTMSSEMDFLELQGMIGQVLRESYRHHQFQFTELINLLRKKGIQSPTRCDVRLSYEKHDYNVQIQDAIVDICPLTHELDEDPLALFIREYEGNQTINLDFHFNQQYFNKNECESIFEAFRKLLKEIPSQDDRELKSLKVFNKKALSYLKGKTTEIESYSILELFHNQVEKSPEKEAVIFRDKSITYEELNLNANRIANLIREKTEGHRERVGILISKVNV